MKKRLLTITAGLSAMIGAAQNTVPNGNFENWVSVPYENPQYYETGNSWAIMDGYLTTEKVADPYHGSFAIKMTTLGTATDTLTAYFANGDPGNPVGQGFPYTEMATGLRGYYKSDIMPGDSANIFVFFKKNGLIIGQYVYKLTGTQTNYTLFNFTFNPPLMLTPDSVLWGATPSNALSGNFAGIPGSMLQLDSVSFTGVTNQPGMMNGDFELWTTDSLLTLPGWELDENNNAQTTDAANGNYALMLQTTLQEWGVSNGFATTGESTQTGTIGGHPYTIQQDTLAFVYKYSAADVNDSANVSVMFKLNGSWIGSYYQRLGAKSTYTYYEIPFNLPQAPDSVIISFNSSKIYPTPASYVGSMLKVDDLHFKSQLAPVASFIIPATVCANQTFMINDNSTNGASGWNWTITGGTPSTSIAQNPAVSYAAAGTYTITLVASNGAGQSAPFSQTISVLAQPTVGITFTPNDTVCEGTSVTLTGTGTPNSVWTGGITDNTPFTAMSSATYIVTGTAGNNCTNTDTITIVVNALPAVAAMATPNDSVCMGDMITLAGTGANSYAWSGGVTDAVAFMPSISASYIVTGTDNNGCSKNDTIDVTVNAVPSVIYTASADTVCEGSMVTLTGAGAVSYAWTGGVTDGVAFAASSSSSYTVTGTDLNGCSDTAVAMITVNPLPSVGYTASPDTIVCDTTMITLSGTGADSYTWNNGITDAVAFLPDSGTTVYIVTGTDLNGCVNTNSVTVVASPCLGIEESVAGQFFTVYPNPINNGATIQFNAMSDNAVLSVVDLTGRNVKSANIAAGTNAVAFSRDGLENGIYFIRVLQNGKVLSTLKVVIE